jgi:peptide chain release factor subunit 1
MKEVICVLTREQIEQLESFDAQDACVLSLYLNQPPASQVEHSYKTVFQDLAREMRDRLAEPQCSQFTAEVNRITEWLEAHQPQGKSLAVFSCVPRGLWQAHDLAVDLRDHLAFQPQPNVEPLLDVLDEYERYAVVLVDKETARLFTVFLGAIEESQAFRDFVPGKHDKGGPSQANFQRHHEAHVYRHLKRVAAYLVEIFRRRPFDRLILAGPEEATSELKRLLPRALGHRLVATIPGEIFAKPAEILERTLEIERRVERSVEQRLLDELFETADAGGRATYGLRQTLEAVWLGKVQTLVVADGVRAAGSECLNCGHLEPGSLAECPTCAHPMVCVPDLIERAVERALDQAGSVEVVHGEAARHLHESGGGLGAFLRYISPQLSAPGSQPTAVS